MYTGLAAAAPAPGLRGAAVLHAALRPGTGTS